MNLQIFSIFLPIFFDLLVSFNVANCWEGNIRLRHCGQCRWPQPLPLVETAMFQEERGNKDPLFCEGIKGKEKRKKKERKKKEKREEKKKEDSSLFPFSPFPLSSLAFLSFSLYIGFLSRFSLYIWVFSLKIFKILDFLITLIDLGEGILINDYWTAPILIRLSINRFHC